MKRTTIFAHEDSLSVLRQIAQRKGMSVAEIVRQALDKFIAEQGERKKTPLFLGIGRSGRKDISEMCEELLWREPSSRKKVSR